MGIESDAKVPNGVRCGHSFVANDQLNLADWEPDHMKWDFSTLSLSRFEAIHRLMAIHHKSWMAEAGPSTVSNDVNVSDKKLNYRREIARQLQTSFSAHSLIVHFTEHRICFTTNYIID